MNDDDESKDEYRRKSRSYYLQQGISSNLAYHYWNILSLNRFWIFEQTSVGEVMANYLPRPFIYFTELLSTYCDFNLQTIALTFALRGQYLPLSRAGNAAQGNQLLFHMAAKLSLDKNIEQPPLVQYADTRRYILYASRRQICSYEDRNTEPEIARADAVTGIESIICSNLLIAY